MKIKKNPIFNKKKTEYGIVAKSISDQFLCFIESTFET